MTIARMEETRTGKTSVPQSQPGQKESLPFRGVLSVYTSKNNINFVLTDVARLIIYCKASGGQFTKRGTEKNRPKCMHEALDRIAGAIASTGMTALSVYVTRAFGNRGSLSTMKMVLKELTTRSWGLQPVPVYNGTPRREGCPPRLAGGRRGRRV